MKLYTEEQLRATWNTAFMEGMSIDSEIYEPVFFEDHLNALTPIELPSEEEIRKEGSKWKAGSHEFVFRMGVNWMRNKIQGDNK